MPKLKTNKAAKKRYSLTATGKVKRTKSNRRHLLAKLENAKTKDLLAKLNVCGLKNCLFIDGKEVDVNFALASRNIAGIDVLPTIGANVYDILKKEKLVLTKEAVACLEERLQ